MTATSEKLVSISRATEPRGPQERTRFANPATQLPIDDGDARPGVELALIGFASTISLRGSSHR